MLFYMSAKPLHRFICAKRENEENEQEKGPNRGMDGERERAGERERRGGTSLHGESQLQRPRNIFH